MDLNIERGRVEDIDELEQLYDNLNDFLAAGINYPGWKKGIYPIRQSAVDGINQGYLYVIKQDSRIVGTVILSHKPEEGYKTAKWLSDYDYSDIIVIHTLAVHPDFIQLGIGRALMNYAIEHGGRINAKSIRLDVYEKNAPAIKLYEKCGFQYIDTVDLGYGEYGLHWFKLYEKLL